MSEFDEEAERERLREKYEKDRERREAAQKMSDLLLKGATMTNAHCGECGSPIFRNQGDEFCPTCDEPRSVGDAQQAAASEQPAPGQDSDGEEADVAGASADDRTAGAAQDAPGAADGTPDATPADQVGSGPADAANSAPADASGSGRADAARSDAAARGAASEDVDVAGGAGGAGKRAGAGSGAAGGTAGEVPDPLADAQRELLAAITEHARAARNADPRTAADHLEAAREAAEALATLSQ